VNEEKDQNRRGIRRAAMEVMPKPTHPSTRESTNNAALQLFDPRRGDVAFQLAQLSDRSELSHPQRVNYFTVLLIREGKGRLHAELSEYDFKGPALLFFNPYQTFFLTPASSLRGVCLQFHANFFCIETHHEAVGCNGVLFNDIYGHPLVQLDAPLAIEFDKLTSQIEEELTTAGLAHTEILVSYLKVFLIKATRLKLRQQPLVADESPPQSLTVLSRLTELIEQHYRTKHSPAHYAAELNMTPKSLGRLVKTHFQRTLTELIRERLLKHAKWQLLHTTRPVKEIAWEVGFADELYFSRLFRRATGCSPTAFREFETAIRGGRNLSM
jgi:AraC family transcriptional regulator, transcriptional activator of pobA